MNIAQFHFGIEYLVVVLAVFIVYLLYYVFMKDAQYSKNIRSIASVVEDLNREIYYLKKELENTKGTLHNTNTQRMSDEEIYQEIERSVYDMVQPLQGVMEQLQRELASVEGKIASRIEHLESGVKQISIPSSIHGNDDEKIIALYRQGVGIETISKELHLSKPEVEFVLKINQIK